MNKVSWTKLINHCKKKYGLKKIVWVNNKKAYYSGQSSFADGIIFLNKPYIKTKRKLIQVLFHEVGHIYCFNNDIWSNYHRNKIRLSKREKELMIRTGLKAERWIDRWAEKEILKLIPKFKYVRGYELKEKRDLYHEHYLSQFR